jgi:hypothetical protein
MKALQLAIDNSKNLAPDLWAIDQFFTQDTLNKILLELEQDQLWQSLERQEHMPRKTLAWQDAGLLDQVWGTLNELNFSKFNLKFNTVSIWKDTATYCIKTHVDNDRVGAAMQIYLSEGPAEIGTWFQQIEIPFIKNTGYIMNNKNKLPHGMKCAVPDGVVRYSLYALFDHV